MSESSQDEYAAVLDLYQSGLSAPQISEELDIPSYRVRLMLKEQGVVLQGGKRNEKALFLERISEELSKGLSIKEVAALIDKPYNTVLRWCREEDLTDQKDKQRLEAVERYRKGETVKDIATSLSTDPRTVSRWLKAAGEDVKIPGRKTGHAPKKLRHFDRVKELHEQGKTIGQIAQEVGVHVDTVAIWLREEGFKPIYKVARQSTRPDVDPRTSPKREEGLRLYREGHTEGMISKTLEVPLGTVRSWISRAGLSGQGGRAVQKERKAARALELYRQGTGIDKISKVLSTSYYIVQQWLIDAGIEIERTAFGVCARETCSNEVYFPDHKYCSEECRKLAGNFRTPDPANWVETVCQNEKCTLPERKFKYRRSQGSRKYCSNACAQKHTKTKQHIVVDDAVVLDSGYETLFHGLCSLHKIDCERFDRNNAIEWAPGRFYGPDFLVKTNGDQIAVELKGYQDEYDEIRWATFREKTGIPLAVLDGETLRTELGSMTTRDGLLTVLWDAT